MATPQRQSRTSLIERLCEEYYRFSFFKAVGLLEAMQPAKAPLGATLEPHKEPVRFRVRPGLGFPASDISGLNVESDLQPATMEVTFLGLVGPAGVLPYWYHELVAERSWKKDHGIAAFLDLFHHRLVTLFYLAWKKYRLEAHYRPGAADALSGGLLCLQGLGTPGLLETSGLPADSLAFYSGLLSRATPSAAAIEAAVAFFADAAVSIEPFIEQLLTIAPEDRTRLGAANSRLGIDAVCGSQVVDCRSRFRLRIGPLEFEEYRKFLPTGNLLQLISNLVRTIAGIEFEFDIAVDLEKETVPLCRLGAGGSSAPLLGWTTWIRSPDFLHDRDPGVVFPELSLSKAATAADPASDIDVEASV